jgi:hypothetical protein
VNHFRSMVTLMGGQLTGEEDGSFPTSPQSSTEQSFTESLGARYCWPPNFRNTPYSWSDITAMYGQPPLKGRFTMMSSRLRSLSEKNDVWRQNEASFWYRTIVYSPVCKRRKRLETTGDSRQRADSVCRENEPLWFELLTLRNPTAFRQKGPYIYRSGATFLCTRFFLRNSFFSCFNMNLIRFYRLI